MSKPTGRGQAETNIFYTDCMFLKYKRKAKQIADAIILEARQRKVALLKTVKEAAEEDIDVYKAQREEELCRLGAEAQVSGVETEKRVAASTQQKLQALQDLVDSNKEAAIARLLEQVLHVEPELHVNLQL